MSRESRDPQELVSLAPVMASSFRQAMELPPNRHRVVPRRNSLPIVTGSLAPELALPKIDAE